MSVTRRRHRFRAGLFQAASLGLLAASLLLWSRQGAGRTKAAVSSGTRPVPAPPPVTCLARARSDATGMAEAVFDLDPDLLAGAASVILDLAAARPAECSAVQVLVTADHHGVFAYPLGPLRLGSAPRRFTLPLRGAANLWASVAHAQQWSAWEPALARRVAVKFHGAVPGSDLTAVCRLEPLALAEPRCAWRCPMQAGDVVALGDRFELAFDVAGVGGNPFDPAVLDVRMRVTGPDRETRTVPAFLYQPFEAVVTPGRERIEARGAKHWRARFRPPVRGAYTYTLTVSVRETDPVSIARGGFEVGDGTPPDFIRSSARAPFWFERGDGRFFYPIGWTILCPIDRPHQEDYVPYLPPENSLTAMRELLRDLAAAGGNCTRFWLTEWFGGLEWNRHMDNYGGIGRYNLRNAWIVDQVLDTCEGLGIKMIVALQNHLRTWPPGTRYGGAWPEHPYARANGGFLDRREDYWTDPRVLVPEFKRLRYVLARFADSPAVHSWNTVSESDLASRGAAWDRVFPSLLARMRYLRENDPYDHPVSTHTSNPMLELDFADLPEFGFLHSNAYADNMSSDQVYSIREFADRYQACRLPSMVTEYAGRWCTEPPRRLARDTIGGLWAGVCSRLSGTPMSWWWNFNYGEQLGPLWRHVADFMQGEDLIAEDHPSWGHWRHRQATPAADGRDVRAMSVGNTRRRFVYVFDYDAVARTRADPVPCTNAMLNIEALAPGAYVVAYWSPTRGRLRRSDSFTAGGNSPEQRLSLPPFVYDLVLKIVPAESAAPAADRAVAPVAVDGARRPPEVDGDRGAWSWRIEPLAVPVSARVAERSYYACRVACPQGWTNAPAVTDAGGRPVAGQWEPLSGRSGWSLFLPGTAVAPFTVKAAVPGDRNANAMSRLAPGRRVTGLEDAAARPVPRRGPAALAGLRLAVANMASHEAPLTPEATVAAWETAALRGEIAAARIDDVENPFGYPYGYFAHYSGPLLAPCDGAYTFALNSDDGSCLQIDGTNVVAWLGCHEMEQVNGPNVNFWQHANTVNLTAGLHWLDVYHYNMGGAQLARLGWRCPPAAGSPLAAVLDPPSTAVAMVQDRFFSGRIPCRVRVYRHGLALLTAVSRPGLRLRRPDRAVHRVRVEQAAGQASPVTLSAARPVRRFVPVDGCAVPVWVESETLRRFSLQLEFVDVPQPGIRLFSHDLDLPLAVALGDPPGDAERKRCARRTWTWWPTPGAAPDTPFVVSTEGLPLLEGRLPSDTRLARCVADREASGRPVLGLRAYAAGVDPVHLRAAAGAGEWLVSPALDLSQPLARRQAMALIAGRAGNEAQR